MTAWGTPEKVLIGAEKHGPNRRGRRAIGGLLALQHGPYGPVGDQRLEPPEPCVGCWQSQTQAEAVSPDNCTNEVAHLSDVVTPVYDFEEFRFCAGYCRNGSQWTSERSRSA